MKSLIYRYSGTIKKAGGSMANRGDILENDYFNKKVSSILFILRSILLLLFICIF